LPSGAERRFDLAIDQLHLSVEVRAAEFDAGFTAIDDGPELPLELSG
jgi:hypothetical protein